MSNEQEITEAEKAYAIFAYWHDELGHDAPIVQQLYSDWQYARQRVEDSKSSQGKNMNMNMNLAPAWVREVAAAKTGIKTGQFFVVQQPSHNTDGVFTPGKVRVFNKRRSAEFTFGTDVVGCVVTDQNVWEMTR